MVDAAIRKGTPGRPKLGEKPQLQDWRDFLTAEERFDLDALEENAQQCDRKRKQLTADISVLRHRASSRRRIEFARIGAKAAAAAAAANCSVDDQTIARELAHQPQTRIG